MRLEPINKYYKLWIFQEIFKRINYIKIIFINFNKRKVIPTSPPRNETRIYYDRFINKVAKTKKVLGILF